MQSLPLRDIHKELASLAQEFQCRAYRCLPNCLEAASAGWPREKTR